MVTWRFYTWDELNHQILYQLLQLRVAVFIIEQNCPYPEMDDKDQLAVHLVGTDTKTNTCVAYARLFGAGKYFKEASIGRVCTSKTHRGTGLGKELMKQALDYMDAHMKTDSIRISAQSYLLDFYKGYGFIPQGDEYLEDGIPHRMMCRHS